MLHITVQSEVAGEGKTSAIAVITQALRAAGFTTHVEDPDLQLEDLMSGRGHSRIDYLAARNKLPEVRVVESGTRFARKLRDGGERKLDPAEVRCVELLSCPEGRAPETFVYHPRQTSRGIEFHLDGDHPDNSCWGITFHRAVNIDAFRWLPSPDGRTAYAVIDDPELRAASTWVAHLAPRNLEAQWSFEDTGYSELDARCFIAGWTARQSASWGRNGRWIFEGPGGERYVSESGFSTALRRFAHLVVLGKWSDLRQDTYGAPKAVDDLWEALERGYCEKPQRLR